MKPTPAVTVSITIDTEEDEWGAFHGGPTSVKNIGHLRELQECFDRWGARPTYLVNRAPLLCGDSIQVLGMLAARENVEIGAHCHPWNTPPLPSEPDGRTMMCRYSHAENQAKLREVKRGLAGELGVTPTSFRAGRWGLGPTVASAIVDEGLDIDCSVSPFVDWSSISGPDYSSAPHRPYRFEPQEPLAPTTTGRLFELPPTIGFPAGDHRRRAALRRRLERSPLRHLKAVGLADRARFLAQRWLSPETSTAEEMIRLTVAWVGAGETFVQATFHSSALLPGATPFVRDESDRTRFLGAIDRFLSHCAAAGFTFRTLRESAAAHLGRKEPGVERV